MPERRAYVGCNLTMPSETHHYGTIAELSAKFTEKTFKGEFVVCIQGTTAAHQPMIDDMLMTQDAGAVGNDGAAPADNIHHRDVHQGVTAPNRGQLQKRITTTNNHATTQV